jgi:hypothetical protein
MDGNVGGLRLLEKWSRLPVERIEYFPEAGKETILTINKGVVFLMAFWSMYAIKAFSVLTKVMSDLNADDVRLVVVDVDGSPELDELPELKGKLHGGYGETLWVYHGEILITSGPGGQSDRFRENTVDLLSMA